MNVTADTNLLVRIYTRDDAAQADAAQDLLDRASKVVLPIAALCELTWVLNAIYRVPRRAVAQGIRKILADPRVEFDRLLVEAGLALLDVDGDFADAIIATDGRARGGDTFATFDRQAARLLKAHGHDVTLLR